jgi:hypothetical protein
LQGKYRGKISSVTKLNPIWIFLNKIFGFFNGIVDNFLCKNKYSTLKQQCFGSGSGLDPNSIKSVDLDPDLESGSGSRRAKMIHKNRGLKASPVAGLSFMET